MNWVRPMTGPGGYDAVLAGRVARLALADPAAVAAVYAAGEAAGRRDAAAYWRTALAPLDAAVRACIAAHDLTSYNELARRRGETWDPKAGRWRPLPRPDDQDPGPARRKGRAA